jgi:2-keto-3-deoxy-L-rhamnonate aldolase RhmA
MVPFVRITEPTQHFLYMKAMEAGAKGVIIPRIKTKEDMEFAVKAVKWPGGEYNGTHGICSMTRRWKYGEVSDVDPYEYVIHDEAETFVIPILETVEAMENLDDILSVKGIDFAIYGYGDLGMTLGVRGRGKAKHDKGMEILEEWRIKTMEACKKNNVPLCQLFWDVESARKRIEEDGCYILGSEIGAGWLRDFLRDMVKGIFAVK